MMPNPTTLERTFAGQLESAHVTGWEREVRILEARRWRFDFGWPREKVLVELQGGIWDNGQGSHQRSKRYEQDCLKTATATMLGYRVLWATSDMVTGGYALLWVRRMLGTAVDVHDVFAQRGGSFGEWGNKLDDLRYLAMCLTLDGVPEAQAYQRILDGEVYGDRRRVVKVPGVER